MLEVEPGRILRVVEAFASQPDGHAESRLCAAAADLLDAAGTGLSLGATDDLCDGALWTVCATGCGQLGERLQFDLGEGPSYTAHRTGRPVEVPDLDEDATWPAFAKAATVAGLHAVFAFPLPCGSGGLGAVTLYRHGAGRLTSDQYADALAVARVSLDVLTSQRAGRSDLDPMVTDQSAVTQTVSQASGMVSARFEIPVTSALSLLRARAFTETSCLADVARQIIEHRIELAPLHADDD